MSRSLKKKYRKVWSNLLDLVDAIHVTVGAPINKIVSVQEGDIFEYVANYSKFSFDDFYPVECGNWTNVTIKQPVVADMDIALCHKVILSGPYFDILLIEHGNLLSEIPQIK